MPKWDEILEGLDDDAKAAFEEHVQGLKNAVAATRSERDALKGRVTEIETALGGEAPAELRQKVADLGQALTVAERRSTFAEQAAGPDVRCRNPRAAWLVAQAEGAFDDKGTPDWAKIQEAAPELFGSAQQPGGAGAGAGTQNQPPGAKDVNSWIRQQAGRS
jgi:hypothetical protein